MLGHQYIYLSCFVCWTTINVSYIMKYQCKRSSKLFFSYILYRFSCCFTSWS